MNFVGGMSTHGKSKRSPASGWPKEGAPLSMAFGSEDANHEDNSHGLEAFTLREDSNFAKSEVPGLPRGSLG